MRILHIITTLDPAAGGPTEVVRFLLTFQAPGYSGEVVTLDAPDTPFLKGLPFPALGLGPGVTPFVYTPKLIKWVRENAHRFDGVVVNGLWQFGGLGMMLGLKGKVPYAVFPHGMLDPYFKRRFPLKHLKKWLYWAPAEYWVLRNAYRVLFTTSEESRLAEQSFWLHRWKGVVVPFGASEPEQTAIDNGPSAFYQHCPELKGRRFLLFLGRIHRKKGCDNLISAFVNLSGEDPELDLVMAGPDEQGWSGDLKAQVAAAGLTGRVHWPGMLKGDVKWGAFLASEAFILPSHQENFGIAVAEALACGRPVLLSDQVNIARDIAAYGAGLMESDTLAGTERLLEGWMRMSGPERAAMGLRATACFREHYDMRRCAETIIKLFEDARAG